MKLYQLKKELQNTINKKKKKKKKKKKIKDEC